MGMLRFDHVGGIVDDRLRNQGFDTVGEVQDYGNIYRLCYVRGPEGLIVELAEQIAS
jgi:catechol 2,3-dioxygenase-like lactoylglutathione lyase family enzyme